MGLFDGNWMVKEALKRIDDHVRECKENNTNIYNKIDNGNNAMEKRFDDAHKENKKRLDAMVWASLIGAFTVILFLLDKIATTKGIWS